MKKYVCIHGHFYQPPRENPWLEKVEEQESAYPYHDWNQRVDAKCYAPNTAARILDPSGRIIGLSNSYSQISFNFGPTLLYWLEKNAESTYRAIIEGDKLSVKEHSGHGSAIAQAYNHMIMPLANQNDKITQIKWGIKDFTTRFERPPEGMWLPETAVNTETLELLSQNKIKFTILSPTQAKRIRKIGNEDWWDVYPEKIDPRRAYLYRLSSGNTISLFFYDKRVSTDAAFGALLCNGESLAKRLMDAFGDTTDPALVNIASDGELYGYHHTLGEMTLAYCLYYLKSNNLAKITNYGEFLEKQPPQYEAEIIENTSWSCSHGVERWRNDCGDNSGMQPGWRQTWRKPLREALDWLRDMLLPEFTKKAKDYFKDPWEARNDYIDLINDRSPEKVKSFLEDHSIKPLNKDEKRTAIKLLEMQRHAMLMYTSCGWFFDEISGIETVQILTYAARVIQLAKEIFSVNLEEQFVSMLAKAPSNIAKFGDGAWVYNNFVKPQIADLQKIGAQHAILWSFQKGKIHLPRLYNSYFNISEKNPELHEVGKFHLALGQLNVKSNVTLDEASFGSATIWLGDHNVSCGLVQNMPNEMFKSMGSEFTGNFQNGLINETIELFPKYFTNSRFSLKDLFRDDQKSALRFIMRDDIKKADELNELLFSDSFATLAFLREINVQLPKAFQDATDLVLNERIISFLSSEEIDIQGFDELISNMQRLGVSIDKERVGFEASKKIDNELKRLAANPQDVKRFERVQKLIEGLNSLSIDLDLWSSQNLAVQIAQKSYRAKKELKQEESWLTAFERLCDLLKIKL